MKRSAQIISGMAVTLMLVAVVCWLFAFAKLNIRYEAMHISIVPLAAMAVAAYLLNRLMMTRGASAPLFIVAQILMMVGAAFLFRRCIYLEPFKLRTAIICGGVYCLLMPVTAFLTFEPVKKSGLILSFEILTIFLALSFLLGYIAEIPCLGSALAMGFVALAAVLLALIMERVGRYHGAAAAVQGSRWAGRIMLAAAFAFVAVLTTAAVMLAYNGVQRFAELCALLLQKTVQTLLAVLKWIYGVFEAFMTWLSQFFDPEPLGPLDIGPQGGAMPETDQSLNAAGIPNWAYIVLAVIALALLAYCLVRLRKHRFAKVRVHTVRYTAARRESNAHGAWRELLRKLSVAVRYRVYSIRYRKTAPGLLAWCEKHAAKEQQRMTGESGEAFLQRLAAANGADALNDLAAALEKTLYAREIAPVSPQLYKKIKKIKFSS